MKKSKTRLTISLGVICVLLVAVSSWYSITFNDSRLVAPMELSEYVFRVQDLPMIISVTLFALYILYIFVLMLRAVIADRRQEAATNSTRTISPKMGFLGFLGFGGFLGFWTYSMDKIIFPFVFFMFFGYFGFFFEGKMSNTFMDERYKENKMKAHLAADKTALAIIFLSMLILGQGMFMGNPEYTLIALIIVISLSIALEVFLSEYLLYRYDYDEQLEESEE